ncbi:MAG: ABC transporter permease, partial [Prevotellaceae bacterium]|nr:ABC transporter permease [Prevotellaceae bacterium]
MLKYLIQKEFLQIRRNAFLPRLIVIFPIMMMCVMPWVMNQEVKNIRVDVVDNDRSTLSRQLVHSIEASNYF